MNNKFNQIDIPRKHQIFFIAGLIIVGVLLYANTLNSPFVLDDGDFILEDAGIRITDLSAQELLDAARDGKPRHRLLPNMSWAVNYYFGQYHVVGYHVVNIMIHLMTAAFLFLFFHITFKQHFLDQKTKDNQALSANAALIAFFAALIWMAHPIQTNAVTYICQRMASMVAMFFILTLLLYIKGRLSLMASGKFNIRACTWFAAALLSGACAMASKQNAGMLPLVIFLYEWFFFQNLNTQWIRQKLIWLVPVIIIIGALAFIYMGENPVERIINSYSRRTFTLPERLFTECRVIIYYISLLVYPGPDRFNLEHDFPISGSFAHPSTTWLSFTAILVLFGLAVYRSKTDRLAAFCIFWFFINLLIESSVIGLEIIFEHRTYIPSMLPAAWVATAVFRQAHSIRRATVCFIVLIAILAAGTVKRNHVWQNDVSILQDCITKSPQKLRPLNNLANVLQQKGRILEAMTLYKQLLDKHPDHVKANSNLACLLLNLERIDDAFIYFKKALSLDPANHKTHINIAMTYRKIHNLRQAEYHFLKAIQNNPDSANAHSGLGDLYLSEKKYDQALQHYKKSLARDPNNAMVHNNIGVALIFKKNIQEAISHFKKAMELDPDCIDAKKNLIKLLYPGSSPDKKIRMLK